MEIDIPRDREAKFEPIIIKKYERDISELVEWYLLYILEECQQEM
ncbi:transposase [Mycoplasmopsis fermentans]